LQAGKSINTNLKKVNEYYMKVSIQKLDFMCIN